MKFNIEMDITTKEIEELEKIFSVPNNSQKERLDLKFTLVLTKEYYVLDLLAIEDTNNRLNSILQEIYKFTRGLNRVGMGDIDLNDVSCIIIFTTHNDTYDLHVNHKDKNMGKFIFNQITGIVENFRK